jgi:AP2-like factor, ANT lineage
LNAVTNFDITRYDVEKIMESNVLLAGEEARKVVKAIEPGNGVSVTMHNNSGRELNPTSEASAEWRMVLHGPPRQEEAVPVPRTEADDLQKSVMGSGDPHCSLHGIVGYGVACEAQHDDLDVSGGGVNFSNSSSLVTSLGNSREGSPGERLGQAMFYNDKHPNAAVRLATVSPWMQTPAPAASHMLRPPSAAVSHLPVYAAWADA